MSRKWTAEEKDFVREWFGLVDAAILAWKLDREPLAVRWMGQLLRKKQA